MLIDFLFIEEFQLDLCMSEVNQDKKCEESVLAWTFPRHMLSQRQVNQLCSITPVAEIQQDYYLKDS